MANFRIGIDMRMAGDGFGIGKYTIQLARALLRRSVFEYVLFFDKSFSRSAYEEFKNLGVECHLVSARYYSLEEQIKLPLTLRSFKLDLVHFLNFNVPIFYFGKYIVTIHDLIHHHFPGTSTRTILWRLGYRVAINLAARRAKRVIAVSENSKRDIISLLSVRSDKVSVVHEAVDESFKSIQKDEVGLVKARHKIHKPYVLWVGVWRRYKNLETLVTAFNKLVKEGVDAQLVLAGEPDRHHPEVEAKIRAMISQDRLVAPGRISSEDLVALYAGATVFVNPSLSEGFGLTSVEAQTAGLPVIASDIAVMHEVLGDSALYFNPKSYDVLAVYMVKLMRDNPFREAMSQKSLANAKRFSWDETAKKTEEVYYDALNK